MNEELVKREVSDELRTDQAGALDRLLGAELSAIHSYDRILKRLDGPAVGQFDRLRKTHEDSAAILRDQLKRNGAEPTATGAPWELLLTIAETSPELMTDPMAIKAIKEGEQRGVDEYEAVLGHCDIDESCRTLLRDRLLPRWQEHLTILGRLLRSV